ncbi:ATP-grasp domain-containing protein [Dactylosporangium sp. NPDC048998]|uniref:ATP-grasp domain-containing protein n=1 Tax=Dactylosporangium sp. NPDC048998 TaxID=3363976 RepID=UPI003723886C
MEDQRTVLVVGSGGRQYREYLLASAARRRPLWLLDSAPPTWQAAYVRGATVVPLLDEDRLVPDRDLLVKAAHEIHAEHGVAGVFTYDETLVTATAHIAESLGLPGFTADGADACRNKHRTRTALTAAGLPQPRFAYVLTPEAAAEAAEAFGYPVVVKPRGAGASIGVVKADGPGDLAAAFMIAETATHGGAPAYEGGVLVEEYLEGPEFSIDGAVHGGRYEPFVVARKRIGFPPYFEETGHTVTAVDPLLDDPEVRGVLEAAHRAVGVRDGITHTEIRLTGRGPCVIEINARLGGDLIPYVGMLATGVDPGRVAVELAVGAAPALERHDGGTVGIRFANPDRDGRITGVRLPEPGAVPGLVEAKALVAPGAVVRLPPRGFLSRYAYVICRAATPEACDAALAEAVALTSADVDPVTD